MPKKPKPEASILLWDGQRLGRLAGAFAGLATLCACFWPYWPFYGPRADSFAAFLRYGWTFLAVFVIAYLGVLWCLRIVLAEFVEQRRNMKPKQAKPAETA